MTIKVGSRDSRLAVVQAEQIIAQLAVPCELVTMKTTGDMILDKTLEKVGGKGLFVKELDRVLAEGRVDLTVHSLKDVPMEQPEGMPLVAFSAREDARDALVLPEGVTEHDLTGPIGCASARRRVQLRRLFPGVEIRPVRGNVQTRLRKLDSGEYGALVLASAGLHRLGLQGRISRYFSADEMIPAAGQAILAVQGREGELNELTAKLDDRDAHDCALAERAYVRTLDGGCFAPVAAYAEIVGDIITLRAMYATEDEQTVVYGSDSAPREEAEALGARMAHKLREEAENR